MVLTRRAQSSATPSPAPSPKPADVANPQSSRKMNKELQRLLIDGNEKMGGVGSSPPKRSRRSDLQHQQSPTPTVARPQPPEQAPEQAPMGHHQRLSTDAIPPTPPLSDKDAPMRPPPPPNPSPARRKSQARTTPVPKSKVKSQTPKPSDTSNSAKPTPSKKRTLHDYFSKKPPESDSKRRKMGSPALAVLAQQSDIAKPIESPVVPAEDGETAIPTTEDSPAKNSAKDQGEALQEEIVQVEEQHKDSGQEPEEAQVEGAQADVVQEKERPPDNAGTGKKNITMTREMKRLQIDAKEALLGAGATENNDHFGGKRKRRHTTAPNDSPAPPNKRPRQSLPAQPLPVKVPTPNAPAEIIPIPSAPLSSSSSIAEFLHTGTDWIPAPTAEQADQIDKYVWNQTTAKESNQSWSDIVADLPTKNPTPPPTEQEERLLAQIRRRNDIPKVIEVIPDAPVWRKNKEPTFLESGEVNPVWISNWLDYVSAICDGPSLEDIPLEARMIEERNEETAEQRDARINREEAILDELVTLSEEHSTKKRKGKDKTTHMTDLHVNFDDTQVSFASDGNWAQRKGNTEKEKVKTKDKSKAKK